MRPKYSIVIPTVNNVNCLISCVESILKSSDPQKIEIIVVDNGSTDVTNQFLTKVSQTYPFIKFITNTENLGFCKATNQGMAISSGDYICWLNDDTVVSKYWLEKLETAITTKNPYHPNIGLVGPVSNNAAGRQGLPDLQGMPPAQVDAANDEFKRRLEEDLKKAQETNPNAIMSRELSGFLSGFCLMFKRDVYNKIGGIDERFSPGGFCDNDFVLRAYNAGFGAVVDPLTIIFHHGSKTLDRYYPGLARGVANWPLFVNKYQTNKSNKLLLVQRVKIDTPLQLKVFSDCSKTNVPLVDGVLLLSDRSELLDYAKAKELFGDKLIEFVNVRKEDGFDERRDRLLLLDKAYKMPYDWCVVLDHDQQFSPSTKRERLDTLMNPFHPYVNAYEFFELNYWRSREFIRIDNNWGETFLRRMWRNIFPPSLRPKMFDKDVGLHCGLSPLSIPEDMSRVCDITVDHFGYADEEEAQGKLDFYNKTDTSPMEIRKQLVHSSGTYDHLKNQGPILVVAPKPFDISLNVMMKNEEVSMGLSLMDYFPIVNDYALIDTGSTDKTVENLEMVGLNVVKMDLDDNFAKIRNKCIELSKSKYCMHIDPDERPERGYLHRIVAMLVRDPDVCLWHLKNVQKTGHVAVTKQPRIFRRTPEIYYSGRVHEVLDESLMKITNLRFEDLGLVSVNTGFLASDEEITKKLEFYGRLLEKEIADNPTNSKAHYELAVHYRNMDRIPECIEMLNRAIKITPNYVVAIRELALIKISEAYKLIRGCEKMPAEEIIIESMKELERVLRPLDALHIKIGKR